MPAATPGPSSMPLIVGALLVAGPLQPIGVVLSEG